MLGTSKIHDARIDWIASGCDHPAGHEAWIRLYRERLAALDAALGKVLNSSYILELCSSLEDASDVCIMHGTHDEARRGTRLEYLIARERAAS